MQELIGQRSRAGFVGRSAERAAFRANFGTEPQDERHRFRFHAHGNAGVGKTFLLRELEQIARERGALTAYVDDSAGSVPEVLAEISRQFAWVLARRARVWRARGDSRRQLSDLDRALELNPDWPWARCERGDALRAAGRDEEAVADLDVALALDPAYTSAYASRGASLMKLGRHVEALADLDRALEMRPGYVWALCRRAVLHAAAGRWEEGRADVERVRELSSEALERLSDTDRAVLAPVLAG